VLCALGSVNCGTGGMVSVAVSVLMVSLLRFFGSPSADSPTSFTFLIRLLISFDRVGLPRFVSGSQTWPLFGIK